MGRINATLEKKIEIKTLLNTTDLSQRKVARLAGVSQKCILAV